MAPMREPERVARLMLARLGLELVSCTELQTLWAGYGSVCAIEARRAANTASATASASAPAPADADADADAASTPLRLILKLICPTPSPPGDEGHIRKMLSYEVEQFFYDEIAPHLTAATEGVAVARCLASTRPSSHGPLSTVDGEPMTATLMTDLRSRFPCVPRKTLPLSGRQVDAALGWLGRFHRSSWTWLPQDRSRYVLPPLEEARQRALGSRDVPARCLWLNGGYTYLATRRSELAALASAATDDDDDDDASEWAEAFCRPFGGDANAQSVAEMVADFLTPRGRPWETCLHGDVKSENMLSTEAGDQVAFFDFQYVGLGLGVCDLAKLFTCSAPLDMLQQDPTTKHEDSFTVPDARLPMGAGEEALLRKYRAVLLTGAPSGLEYPWDDFQRHWETALVDWCRFQASWGFWGNTTWLQARVRWILAREEWRDWLAQQVSNSVRG